MPVPGTPRTGSTDAERCTECGGILTDELIVTKQRIAGVAVGGIMFGLALGCALRTR
jgi:hypothetical protein